jgi:peptidoglycan/xylan/chitin deacetylase (PgdA/CDA1 family)
MRFISPFLKRVGYPLLSRTGYLRRVARNGQLCIVTYHGVRPAGYVSSDATLDGSLVTPDALRKQLRLLKSRYSVICPEQALDWLQFGRSLPERAVLLTCDDGLRNTLTEMLPILQEEELSCLLFVTGFSLKETPEMLWYEQLYLLLQKAPPGPIEIGDPDLGIGTENLGNRQALWWMLVKRLSRREHRGRVQFMQETRERLNLREDWVNEHAQEPSQARRFLLLTLHELRQVASQGMTIGAHTLTHPFLAESTAKCSHREITECRTALEGVLDSKVWALAYPFGNPGSLGVREIEYAKGAGYFAGFVNAGGGFGADLPPFALPRVHVTADMTLGEFHAHVSGFYRTMRNPEARFEAGPYTSQDSEQKRCV